MAAWTERGRERKGQMWIPLCLPLGLSAIRQRVPSFLLVQESFDECHQVHKSSSSGLNSIAVSTGTFVQAHMTLCDMQESWNLNVFHREGLEMWDDSSQHAFDEPAGRRGEVGCILCSGAPCVYCLRLDGLTSLHSQPPTHLDITITIPTIKPYQLSLLPTEQSPLQQSCMISNLG